MRKTILIVSVFSLLAVVIFPKNAGSAQTSYDKTSLAADKAKGDQLGGQLAKKVSALEVLAPLAPVALSPFFGITCLSGSSILCSKGVLPKNDFLMGNKALNNGLVFAIFLALSIATSLPKMTAVSKGFAQATDQLETYAGIISYIVIFYLAGSGSTAAAANPHDIVYTAGIFSFSRDTLLMVAVAINIVVINTVKYFFELLVWISPIPALDAIFETANKAVTAALVAVYAFNPYIAMVINVILFLFCLLIFNWVRRSVKYFKVVYIEPIIAKLLGRTASAPSTHIKAKISAVIEQGEPLLKVFPLRKIHKIKKKELCHLAAGKDGLYLIKLRLIRQPKVDKLEISNAQIDISTGFLTNIIEITSQESSKPLKLTFSRVYNSQIETIAAALKPFGKVRTDSPAQTAQTAKSTGTAPAPGVA